MDAADGRNCAGESSEASAVLRRQELASAARSCLTCYMPQRTLSSEQRLREHLEDALAEADTLAIPLVAALICDALNMLDGHLSGEASPS